MEKLLRKRLWTCHKADYRMNGAWCIITCHMLKHVLEVTILQLSGMFGTQSIYYFKKFGVLSRKCQCCRPDNYCKGAFCMCVVFIFIVYETCPQVIVGHEG